MYTKSQGLEMSTIILAALGIIILLVLVGLVTGKISWFGKALITCPGKCVETPDECDKLDGYNLGGNYKNPESIENKLCFEDNNKFCCSSAKPSNPQKKNNDDVMTLN